MEKDFTKWQNLKITTNQTQKRPFFFEREIWFCKLGLNIGFEEDGKGEIFLRPVIVLKKFNCEIFWAIPLTHTSKSNKFYFNFELSNSKSSTAILSQLRLIDARRLSHRIGFISKQNFEALKEKIRAFLL